MVRKNPAAADGFQASIKDTQNKGADHYHDNDKDSKIKRHKDSQMKAVVFCLAIIAFLVTVAMVRVNHSRKYTPERLRRKHSQHEHRLPAEISSPHEEAPDVMSAIEFLPPHSIYKLQMEDIGGNLVDLSKFHGMVTLVVNVACL